MSQFIYQQKQAWAGIKKKPGFVGAVVATMGTTLGALLCVLTLAYVLIAKPLPYPEQETLYRLDSLFYDNKGEMLGQAFTYPSLIHLYENEQQFSETALFYASEDVLTNSLSQPTLNTAFVTPEYFQLLGVSAKLGRLFEATEAFNTNNPVAVISHQTWVDEYSKDTQILGKKMDFTGISYTIVGVLPADFIEPELHEIGREHHVFMPWDFNHAEERIRRAWGNISDNYFFMGKLTSDISTAQLNQQLSTIVNEKWQQEVTDVEFFKGWHIEIEASTFKKVILGDSENTVFLLLAGVIGLVLIACVNIANLFISRTAEQQRQLAIRAAVGANKSDLFNTIFAETRLLMVFSVSIALIIAALGFSIMQQYLGAQLPRVEELAINWFTLSSAVIIALLLAAIFARLSTRMINYKALNSTLQSSGKGAGIQVSKTIRKILIVSQVAIVTSLVFINISLFQDAKKSIEKPLGFKTDNIVSLVLSFSSTQHLPIEQNITIMTELRKKISALPQVVGISQTSTPLGAFNLNAQTTQDNKRYVIRTKFIDNHYFSMIGQSLIEGDNFSAADIRDGNDIVIVNELYAKELAPQGSVIGTKLRFGGEELHTIIGVVKGTIMPGQREGLMQAYRPRSLGANSMLIELAPGQTITREQAVSVLKEVTTQYTVFDLIQLNKRRSEMLFTQYTTAITSAVLAALTIILSAIGLYGILSYSTQMRGFEIGTRLAIGAKRKDLITLIIGENSGAILTGIIVSIGLLLTLYVGFNEALVDYVSFRLLPIFLATFVVISILSLFACYWPLRQFINRPAIHSLRGNN